jgi:hypothetical protein
MRSCGAPANRSVAPIRRLECVNHFGFDGESAAQGEESATCLPRNLAADRAGAACIRVGLIDSFRARRDCLIEMLARTHPDLDVVSFPDIGACIESATVDLDVILYCEFDDGLPIANTLDHIMLLRETFADIPVVVLPAVGAPAHCGDVRNAFKVVVPRVRRRDRAPNPMRTG